MADIVRVMTGKGYGEFMKCNPKSLGVIGHNQFLSMVDCTYHSVGDAFSMLGYDFLVGDLIIYYGGWYVYPLKRLVGDKTMVTQRNPIKRPKNFRFIYTTEHEQLVSKWEKIRDSYAQYFSNLNMHLDNATVQSMLLSDTQYAAIRNVLREIHAKALPIEVNYG